MSVHIHGPARISSVLQICQYMLGIMRVGNINSNNGKNKNWHRIKSILKLEERQRKCGSQQLQIVCECTAVNA